MNNQKLNIKEVVFYGMPGLPLAMLGLPLFIYLPTFYTQDLGLSLTAVGLALLLARSFDVITDPLIGFLNDRYPKFKTITLRRKSFILLGLPLLLIGLNFLLKPVADVTPFYLFTWSFITYLGWTLINIPWLAMGAEMTQEYHEKSNLASSREIFSAIGTVLVITIPFLLGSQSDLTVTLNSLADILLILIPIALIPLIWKVTINNEVHVPIPKKNKSLTAMTLLKTFVTDNLKIIKHPPVRKILPAYFLNSIANALPATLFILYVSYVLQTPNQVGILLITYFLSAILGIPFWLYIARITDKHTSWRYALYGSIASFIWVPLIGQGDFIAFLLVCLASGFCLGADVVMPSSIQADISQSISNNIEDDTNKESININVNNQNSTGLLFGIWGMLTKLSLAIAIGVAFPVLDLVGLELNEISNNTYTETGTLALIILYALIPIILKIIVVIRIRDFPFNQDYFSTELTSQDQKLIKV